MKTVIGFASLFLFLVITFFIVDDASARSDTSGSKDHPMIKRYPGSVIYKYVAKAFDETNLPTGKALKNGFKNSINVAGKITAIDYKYPKGKSTIEVYKNYAEALLQSGFEPLYTCVNDQCGKGGPNDKYLGYRWVGFEQRHLTAKLTRDDGDIFVVLHVNKGKDRAYVTVIEAKPMKRGLVKVDANALINDIERTGHASIYGIYFDSGKAFVKPESKQALGEIAKLLKKKNGLNLYVVGHTDSDGKLDYNKDLSRRRAKAVVDVLVKDYGVKSSRLHADGVGPLSPVSSNSSDVGKSKNRRVELVAR